MPTKQKRDKEYKSLHLAEVKTVDEETGKFSGYLAFFGNSDKVDDVIERGAFKKTLQESKAWSTSHNKPFVLPILWQHNRDVVLGGFTDAYEDEKGLFVEGFLDLSTGAAGYPNNPEATKAYSGLKIGYIDEMSIGYYVIKREYKDGTRYLKELSVFEGSLVTTNMACNPEALVTSVKTEGEAQASMIDFNGIYRALRGVRSERKDFDSHYSQALAQGVLTDWYDLTSSLRQASTDLFTIGDTPLADAEAVIEQFRVAYLAWVQSGIDANLSEYIASQQASNGGYIGYMSNPHIGAEGKAGRAISDKNYKTMQDAVKSIKSGHDSLSDLLDEYNISNDNINKTIPEPSQDTRYVVEPLVQSTPLVEVAAEVKSVPTEAESQEDAWLTALLNDAKALVQQ